jgi:ribonuclease P protein component
MGRDRPMKNDPDRSYPPRARLRLRSEVRAVLDTGEVFPGRQCLVRRTPNAGLGARLGIAAPRAYGGAVRRNRFRRLVREAFREVRPRLGDHDLFVTPRRGLTEPTLEGVRDDLLRTTTGPPAPRQDRRAAGPRAPGQSRPAKRVS